MGFTHTTNTQHNTLVMKYLRIYYAIHLCKINVRFMLNVMNIGVLEQFDTHTRTSNLLV